MAGNYLFVAGPERHPERAEKERLWWSCSKATEEGDQLLVYVKGAGITYIWRAVSDARPHEKWKYICDVEHVRTLAKPVPLARIQQLVSKENWAPPHANFRGLRSVTVPAEVVKAILAGVGGGASANTYRSPDEVEGDGGLHEGAVTTITVNAYERNPAVRAQCIAHHGARCSVCGLAFSERYGKSAEGYIQVHHLKPLSSNGKKHKVDPKKDVVPMCANCHAVVHLREPPFTLTEAKTMLKKAQGAKQS